MIGAAAIADPGWAQTACASDSSDTYARHAAALCRGSEELGAGNYEGAALEFREALAMRLHEVPNFEGFAPLAEAEWRGGNVEAAGEALERSRIAMMILIGRYECSDAEVGVGWALRDSRGEDELNSDAAQEVNDRMCPPEVRGWHRAATLEDAAHNGELIRRYLDVRDLMAGASGRARK